MNENNKKNIKEEWNLLIHVLSGEKSPDDSSFVEWLKNEENSALYEYLKSDSIADNQWNKEYMFDNISRALSLDFAERKKVKLKKMLAVAACVAVIVAGTLFAWISDFGFFEKPLQTVEDKGINIIDRQKVTLTLENGKTIDLSSNFVQTKLGNTLLTNDSSGIVRYIKEDTLLPPTIHTLEIPYGEEYKLILSDGTKIYLNSGSKIQYPSYFAGNQRLVVLEGEAYFDVAKSDNSFTVQTKDIDIKVLGTTFNVKAYKEERYVNTTLVEGRVQVNTKHNNKQYIMQPNHNFNYDVQTHRVRNEEVNVSLYTAWTQGKLIFHNQKLEDIMLQLARWYNISIDYEDHKLKELRFTGSADKSKDVDYILKQIEKITNIKYKKDEREIIIYN